MRRQRKAKIVATLGPASATLDMIEKLFLAGADVFRINMSHSDHDNLKSRFEMIRKVEKKHGRPIAILVDLQGPKLRIGEFSTDEVTIRAGDTFVLDASDKDGDETRVHLPHPEIFQAVQPGEHLLLNDGRVRLEIVSVTAQRIETRVIFGGVLSARKGVNLPDTVVPLTPLTDKDLADLEFALTLDIDWVALSFVQRADDVSQAREIVGERAGIMVKVEKPAALKSLTDIVAQADAIMVARGDLGVELPLESVPGWQKRMVRECRKAGKPVVVATQMLESMINEPVPTRAEVSDVATALFEGADAVMLSAESAAGNWPEKAVQTMDRIARSIEDDQLYSSILSNARGEPQPTSADAIANAARTVADTLNVSAIVCYTGSGSTGLRVARERPDVPVIALTPIRATGRRLAVVWGLHCVLTADAYDLDDMVQRAADIARNEKFAKPGERIVITAGVPLRTPGKTNMLRVARVAAPE